MAAEGAPHLETPLDRFPRLSEAMQDVVSHWQMLQGLEGGPRPTDIVAHLDVCGVTQPFDRERIYHGILTLQGVLNSERAKQTKAK